MRLFANANFDFIGHQRIAITISAVLIGIGLLAGIFFQVTRGSWLNYGVDFTGGTLVQLRFTDGTTVGELRALFGDVLPGSEITRFGADNEFLVRAPQVGEDAEGVTAAVVNVLNTRYSAGQYEVVRTEAVGPKVGSELQQKAALAILVSFIATLIYLAFRFEWRFGLASLIATIYDVLATLGLLALLQLEVALTTVAALLTIVGYSLNDTIVVFDRIRENLKKSGRREEFVAIVNRSINETLPRTVLTSVTTVAVLVALFVFGGAIIRPFALIMTFGVVVGTYSSIFIASPALLYIERRWGGKKVERPKRSRPVRAGASS